MSGTAADGVDDEADGGVDDEADDEADGGVDDEADRGEDNKDDEADVAETEEGADCRGRNLTANESTLSRLKAPLGW